MWRPRKLAGLEHEHARDIDGDVAVADHNRPGASEVEPGVGGRRMAVVPGDEAGGGIRAGAVLAGNRQAIVVRRSDGVDDGVVVLEQLGTRDVGPKLDAAEEAKAGLGRRLLVHARDRLDLWMVGRDARPDQAEGGGQRVEQVDLEARLEQLVGGIKARRSRADDDGAQAGAHTAAPSSARDLARASASAAARPSEIAGPTRRGTTASPITCAVARPGTSAAQSRARRSPPTITMSALKA